MADRTEDLISFLEFFRVVPNGQLFCIFSAESENAEGDQRSLVASVATRFDFYFDVQGDPIGAASNSAVQMTILKS